MTIGEAAVGIPEHHAIGNRFQVSGRAELRYAVARRRAKCGERSCWPAGLECKRRVGWGREVHMVRPYLVNKRAALWPCNEVVWIANWRRNYAIHISWQESLFTRAANNAPRLGGGSPITDYHLDAIKHEGLRAEEGCAQG